MKYAILEPADQAVYEDRPFFTEIAKAQLIHALRRENFVPVGEPEFNFSLNMAYGVYEDEPYGVCRAVVEVTEAPAD